MPTYHPITTERHGNKYWHRYTDYRFAANEAIAPLVGAELPKAVLSLPMAFVEQEDTFLLVAVLGIETGKNLHVAPDGRWIQSYIPAFFRSHPFRLANTGDGQQVLCIDEDSGLLMEDEGEAFIDTEGQPAEAIQGILKFLTAIEHGRVATARACAVLGAHGLIVPWPITVKGDDSDKQIAGLFKIDETKLTELSPEALAELRDAGALPVIYCQLLSMQHLPLLGELAQVHAKAVQPAAPMVGGELDLEFLNQGGTISFGGLI